jgi:hypothetical protein
MFRPNPKKEKSLNQAKSLKPFGADMGSRHHYNSHMAFPDNNAETTARIMTNNEIKIIE